MSKWYEHADVRFNGGAGALLCSKCSIIIDYGFDHEDKVHYCEKCAVDKPIDYVIEDKGFGTYILYSIVDTDFGGPAKNFVAKGPKDYVEYLQSKLVLDELAKQAQELGLE